MAAKGIHPSGLMLQSAGIMMAPLRRVALVTPFPHESRRVHGVADYARHLADALHEAGMDIEVWADRLPTGDPDHVRTGRGPRVLRNWRPGVLAGADLYRALRERRPAMVHVQVEHFVFGGMVGLASLQPFLLAARLAGVPLVVTLHHVASAQLTRTMLRQTGVRLPTSVARMLQNTTMRFLGSVATRIIVHDDVFRHRLVTESGVCPDRIDVIPHGVPHPLGRGRRSGPPTLLMFGYVKWYKGVDIALDAFRLISSEISEARLIIAGDLPQDVGRHHPHRQFLEQVRQVGARLGRRVEFLGYVADEVVPQLYDAATVVLFPYRALFGASGPLALAFGYRKPFIVSDVLSPLVPFWPFTAPNSPECWAEAIRRLLTAPGLQESAGRILAPVAATRQWSCIASATIDSYHDAGAVPRAMFDVP